MAIANIPDRIKFFIHPVPLTAVALMAVNDHWGKYAYPGWITGKLSDFCGVFYLPIFLLALVIVFDELFRGGKFRLSKRGVIAAIVFTDFLMVLVKLSPASARWIEAFFANYLFQIQLIQDPTDLIAFIVDPLTYWYLKPYWTASKEV